MQKPALKGPQPVPQRAKGKVFLGGYMSQDLATEVGGIVKADSTTVSQVIRTALVQFLKQWKAAA